MPGDQSTVEGAVDHVSAEDLQRWSQIYKTEPRQLRRWQARGIEKQRPCPFNRPDLMPAWWAATSRQIVPAKIMSAAQRATDEKSAAPSAHGTSSNSSPASSPGSSPPPELTSVDITQFQIADTEGLASFSGKIVVALFEQLKEAYLKQWPTESIQSRLVKAIQTHRQLEKDDREHKVHEGLFLPRATQERDAAIAAGMLRELHETMVRRVLEQCPTLRPRERAQVADAITRQRAREQRCLQRLPTYNSADDLLADLAAA